MKHCQNCGVELNDDANFCASCGYAANPIQNNSSAPNSKSSVNSQSNNTVDPTQILAKRCKIYGILIIVTAALNILSIVFLFWGLYDLYWGFKWLEIGKKIPKLTEKEIVKVAESYSRTSTIILYFIFNLMFLGPIGGIATFIYYCVAISGFIKANKSYFESLEQEQA